MGCGQVNPQFSRDYSGQTFEQRVIAYINNIQCQLDALRKGSSAPPPGSGNGAAGKSAYQSWLDQGNIGSEDDFVKSLKGRPGEVGLNVYQLWLQAGNSGTLDNFLTSIKGATGKSAYEIWLSLGNTGSEQDFINFLKPASGGNSAGEDVGIVSERYIVDFELALTN